MHELLLPIAMEQSDYVGLLAIAIAMWIFMKVFAARKSRNCESSYPEGKCPDCDVRMLLSGPTFVDRILSVVFVADYRDVQMPQMPEGKAAVACIRPPIGFCTATTTGCHYLPRKDAACLRDPRDAQCPVRQEGRSRASRSLRSRASEGDAPLFVVQIVKDRGGSNVLTGYSVDWAAGDDSSLGSGEPSYGRTRLGEPSYGGGKGNLLDGFSVLRSIRDRPFR